MMLFSVGSEDWKVEMLRLFPAIFQLEESCVECGRQTRGGGGVEGWGGVLNILSSNTITSIKTALPLWDASARVPLSRKHHRLTDTLSLSPRLSNVGFQIMCTIIPFFQGTVATRRFHTADFRHLESASCYKPPGPKSAIQNQTVTETCLVSS